MKELIVSEIKGDKVVKDGITLDVEPRCAYLVPNTDGTHERYVSDDNSVLSKQGKNSKNNEIIYEANKNGIGQKVYNKTLIIKEGVKSIRRDIFAMGISEIKFPESLEIFDNNYNYYLGNNRLEGVIKVLNLPKNLRIITKNSFKDLGIEEVNFNDKLEYIGAGAFSGNDIKKLDIPESVKVIGNNIIYYDNYKNRIRQNIQQVLSSFIDDSGEWKTDLFTEWKEANEDIVKMIKDELSVDLEVDTAQETIQKLSNVSSSPSNLVVTMGSNTKYSRYSFPQDADITGGNLVDDLDDDEDYQKYTTLYEFDY